MDSEILELVVKLRKPRDPSVLTRTWTVQVTCVHGTTKTPWKRICPDGCHLRSAAGAARCRRVTPPERLVIDMGVVRHGLRYRCGCDEFHWMAHGPEHHQVETHVWIKDQERRLPADEEAELRAAIEDDLEWGSC